MTKDGKSAHFYRYRYADDMHHGGLLGVELEKKWADVMKKEGMIIRDSRGQILGRILIDLVIDRRDEKCRGNIVRVLYRFEEE